MFNKVILVGNLTRDIELRYAGNNLAIGNTGIAVNRKWSSGGEKKEEVCFVDITFFGRTAEVANQYLRKGSSVLIEGRLKLDQWKDQNGQNRSKHSIVVETMKMLGGSYDSGQNTQSGNPYNQDSRKDSYQNQGYQQNSSYQQNRSAKQENFSQKEELPEIDVDDIGDDEIPF